MKKLLYILFFLLVGLTAIAQETPPSGLKAINAQFYIHLPDSTIWQQKGTPYNWHRVAKYSELQAMGLLYLLKSDSAHYTTRSYFGINGVKYSDTAAFKKKIDSVSNSGYTTHGYFNQYGIKWIDTLGSGTVATKYYVEHAAHTWYGSQTFKGNLEVQGALLYVRPSSGTNPYVYADNTTINAINAADNAAILLNGNSTTLQYNIGSLIGTLHADNMTANRVWQLPDATGTLALTSDIPGGGTGGTVVNSFNGSTGVVVFNSVAYVSTISDLQSYSGSQLTVSVGDLVRGGIFDYTTTSYTPDGGTIFAATGKGSGYWIRRYNGIDLYPKWFYTGGTFAAYNPTTNTGSDMSAAIQAAIDSKINGTATVQIPDNYRISTTIKLKQGTNIVGRATLFPYQLSGTDTIKYRSQTAIWADAGIDAFTTTQDTVTYRNQGIKIDNLGIFSIGDTRLKTGLKLYNNPNTSAALVKPGLPKITNCSFSGWAVGLDGKDADSFDNIWNHYSECKIGSIGGGSETYTFRCDYFKVDSVGHVSQGSNDITAETEFEPNTTATSLVITGNAYYATVTDNSFKKTGRAILINTGSLKGNINIELNHFYGISGTEYIRVDSTATGIDIRNNHFLSDNNNLVTAKFISATGVSGIRVVGNNFRKYTGGLVDYPTQFINCTEVLLDGNTYTNFTGAFVPPVKTGSAFASNYGSNHSVYGPKYTNTYQYNVSAETTNGTSWMGEMFSDATGDATEFVGRRSGGTVAAPTAVVNNMQVVAIKAQPYNGTSSTATKAAILMKAVETHSSSAAGTVIDFQTTAPTTTTLLNTGRIGAKGIFMGAFTDATAWFDATGSTAQAPFRMRSSAAPTSPNSGDFWNLSGVPQFYTGTVTQSLAFLASPTFTGTPAAPTAAAGTNTTQLATTAHVFAERTNTATLTNKTLTSPQINSPLLNTTSVIGQVWTATNTAGAGGWATASVPNRSHTLFAPTTGGTVNTVVNQDNIINPAGALATLTINLPSSPANNDKVFLTFTQAVTAISYTGGTVVGVPVSASLGSQWFLTYDTGTTTWY